MKAGAKSFLKYVLAIVLVTLIVRHAGTDKIIASLKQIPPLSWLLALLFTSLAQIISAFRMRFFFRAVKFPINVFFALKLFYVGALYNFLLPGGIGGDAYKVILVRARMKMSAMQGIRVMLADRASGLCILMLAMFLGVYIIDFSAMIPHITPLLFLCAAVSLLCYLAIAERFLKKSPRVMLVALLYSFGIQGLWVATLYVLWDALSQHRFFLEYIVLYCAATVASMLPVSVGGLGIKEMTYFYGAKVIHDFAGPAVDPELGVTLSLCLFAIGLITSLPGLLWLNKVKSTAL